MRRLNEISRLLLAVLCICLVACRDDVTNAGGSVLSAEDPIVVLADTFDVGSHLGDCASILSHPDSLLLGELETDYGMVRAAIMTQLACPEGYSYPANAVIDSVCLMISYGSWMGDGYSPLALSAYRMDRGTFDYAKAYTTNINIDDYCSREKNILRNHRIVVATEKLDSATDKNGNFVPMLRMRLNEEFQDYFGAIRSFTDQAAFNRQMQGLLLETSFGSSTMLNITDIAIGVFYSFAYSKAGRDTTVHDTKMFYANSEIRTINHIEYPDKDVLLETLAMDSDSYNYIIAPAGVYTHMEFPMEKMIDHMEKNLRYDSIWDSDSAEYIYFYKRPYVNKAQLRVDVQNKYTGAEVDKQRNDWLQPADYMLLIKESSLERFFAKKELPSDSCALLSSLTQGKDSVGNAIYYYSYDLSDFLTGQLRHEEMFDPVLRMVLVPVTVTLTATGSAISEVKQQQTMSATKITSAKNGMTLKLVYCGF